MAKIIHLIGTSGSGKTSVHPKLNEKIRAAGYEVVSIVEPGPLREIAKEYRRRPDASQVVQAGLFTADRMVVYWTNQIMQRINEPKLVFSCARGLLDNVLYQGIIGGAPIEMLLWMNQNIPKSDLYIAMTVDGLIGHQRCLSRERGGGEKVSPNETPESIDNFAAAYRKLPEIFPNHNIKFIDTTYLTKEKTLESCWSYVKEML